MTKTPKEQIEEVVSEFEEKYAHILWASERRDEEAIDWLRTTLLTLRREWLEERVKKMEYMLNDDGIGWSDEIKGFNTALQTLIDEDRKELEELTN